MKSTLGAIFTIICVLIAGLFVAETVLTSSKTDTETIKEIQILVSIFWASLGALWMALSIYDYTKTKSGRTRFKLKKQVFIENPAKFINRKDDIDLLLDSLASHRYVNIYGQKGVGKSEFLKYTADLLSRKESLSLASESVKGKVQNLPKNILYIDVNDSVTWTESISEISRLSFNEDSKSMLELAEKSERAFKKNNLIIILDNVNNVATTYDLLKSLVQYSAMRKSDYFIVSSISKIIDPNLDFHSIYIQPFSENHCKQFLYSKGITNDNGEIERIIQKSSGLPLFLSLFSIHLDTISRSEPSSFSGYFISQIYSSLVDNAKDLLNFISVCNIVLTNISYALLKMAPFPQVDAAIRILSQQSTIIEMNFSSERLVKAHDLIRDICLDHIKEDLPKYAKLASDLIRPTHKLESITLMTISSTYSNSELKYTIRTIKEEVDNNNYTFLISIWSSIEQWANVTSMVHRCKELKDLCAFGYVIALLGIGEYRKAEAVIASSAMNELRSIRPYKISNTFEFDLLYAIADLDHLLNRYELARSQAQMLASICGRLQWQHRKEKALWLCAHLTGHVGDSLDEAYMLYESCIQSSYETQNTLMKLRSRNGQLAIKFTQGKHHDIEEAEIRNLISASENLYSAPLESALWRNLSRYHRLIGSMDKARAAITKSRQIANDNNLRTTINCSYAAGENSRFEGRFCEALEYYTAVIRQTEVNGDKNIFTSAILAACICDILNRETIYSKSYEDIGKKIAYVETVAKDIDMHITSARASIVKYFYQRKYYPELALSERDLLPQLKELNLQRDIEILKSNIDNLKYLEIHVH